MLMKWKVAPAGRGRAIRSSRVVISRPTRNIQPPGTVGRTLADNIALGFVSEASVSSDCLFAGFAAAETRRAADLRRRSRSVARLRIWAGAEQRLRMSDGVDIVSRA